MFPCLVGRGKTVLMLGGLRLALRWDSEVGKLELRALGVRANKISLFCLKEC